MHKAVVVVRLMILLFALTHYAAVKDNKSVKTQQQA